QVGRWAPIGAEKTASGYEVAWKLGSDQYIIWLTDSSGNFTSTATDVVSGTDSTLQSLETSFQQDLNSDGVTGLNLPKTVVETAGVTDLVKLGSNYFFYPEGGTSGPE